MNQPDDRRRRVMRDQLHRTRDDLSAYEQPFREAIAAMETAAQQWQGDWSTSNRQVARFAIGELVESMAAYIGRARNVATAAAGLVPDATRADMWHVIADLHEEHTTALLFLRNLEQTEVPVQTTATLPLRAAVLKPILARWPKLSEG